MAEAERMILTCYKADEQLFLLGSPGMGKTALFESVAKTALGIGFIDFRFTMRDPVDIGGMRIPNTKTGVMQHFPPDDLPDAKRHGKRGIFLCDEINSVGAMMQAAGYGLIQERRAGSYRMPEGWVPMASGNNVGDRASAQRISTALANRFNVQVVVPDVPSWCQQFGNANVDARGVAFLRFNPKLFHVMPTADQTAFPSARSWTKAFKFIDEEPAFRRKMFTGYVGEAAAGEFEAFWRIMEAHITLDEILADPKGARTPELDNPGLCYAIAGMVGAAIDRKNFEKLAVYIERLIQDYQVCIMQGATARDKALLNTSAYGRWAVAHQEILI
jgi:hypothetical protein